MLLQGQQFMSVCVLSTDQRKSTIPLQTKGKITHSSNVHTRICTQSDSTDSSTSKISSLCYCSFLLAEGRTHTPLQLRTYVRSRALPDKQPQSGFCRRAVGRRLCVQGQWPRSVQGQGRRCRAPALGRDEGGGSVAKGSALLTNPFSRGDGGRIRNNPLKIKHVVSSVNCGTAVGRSFPRPSETAAGSATVATPRGQTVCPRPLGPSCALPCPQTTRTMRSPLSL